MSEYEHLEKKVTNFGLRGFFNTIKQSPIAILHRDGPPPPRVGTLGFGGNVTMKDGSTEKVVFDVGKLNPGERVIVYTQGVSD